MTTNTAAPYLLGSSDGEIRRLTRQSDMYANATEDVLRRAGIGPGMRVLDVGTGVGGVAMLASRLVGPTGSVTAVDRDPKMVALARARTAAAGNVRVVEGDVADLRLDRGYDAVTGRFLLMHLPDPVTAVRELAGLVRPGGLVVFADMVVGSVRQVPTGPLFRTALDRVVETFTVAGRPVDLGLGLGRIFLEAGLPKPRMTVAGVVDEGPDAVAYSMLAGITATLLPIMTQLRVADASSVGLDTLEERLRREAARLDAVVVSPLLGAAWARVPD